MERSEIKHSFVLDSSVIIKWFSNEENTENALKIREMYMQGSASISCPDLVIYEIANALRYNKSITEKEIKDGVNSLISMGISIIVPTRAVIESAISIALRYDITIYDAYFVALANEIRYTLVTADIKLFNKVKKAYQIKLLGELDFK